MNIETKDILRSFTVIKQMLADRNLNIQNLKSYSDFELLELSGPKNIPQAKNPGNIFQIKVNDNTKIIYHMKNKFIKQDIKKFFNFIGEEVSNDKSDTKVSMNLIFIFKEKINNNNEKNIRDLLSDGMTYEIFPIKNVLFNITEHSFVPKHEILSIDEALQVQTNYSITNKSQFPIILKTDPVAKYYAIKPGQLVKITRSSTSTGDNITYRYCV